MPNFDPAGLSQKLGELYALSDNELLSEAKAICQDLSAWLNVNFTLTAEQIDYLSEMPEMVRFAFGAQFGAVIIGRGPIEMNPDNGPKRTKQTRGAPDGFIHYTPGAAADIQLNGTITFLQP